jgi:hypothetical protein
MRQISHQQIDAITDAIHDMRMTSELINRLSQEMSRKDEGWELHLLTGDIIAHFAYQQAKASQSLATIFEAAIVAK